MSTVTVTVPGMSCGHCAAAVRAEVGRVAGVTAVDVDLATKVVVITGAGLDVGALVAAVDEAGYHVDGDPVESDPVESCPVES